MWSLTLRQAHFPLLQGAAGRASQAGVTAGVAAGGCRAGCWSPWWPSGPRG